MVQIFKQKSLNFLIEVKQSGKFRLFPKKFSRFGHIKYTHMARSSFPSPFSPTVLPMGPLSS